LKVSVFQPPDSLFVKSYEFTIRPLPVDYTPREGMSTPMVKVHHHPGLTCEPWNWTSI
jgi:hypothetical protein